MNHAPFVPALMFGLAAALGCSGSSPENPTDTSQQGGNQPKAGAAGNRGTGGSGGAAGTTAACGPQGAPPSRVWRLSPVQVTNTLDRSFGVKIDPGKLPGDGIASGSFSAFENVASHNAVFDQLASAYADVAQAAADAALPKLRAAHGCLSEAKPTEACGRELVEDIGAKAFRRPLNGDETSRYAGFFGKAAGQWGSDHATGLTMQALLLSPDFLYRSEIGEPGQEGRTLGPYEIASALSYGLADVPPDAELLEAARSGKLQNGEERRRQAQRVMRSNEAKSKLVDFFQQLLKLKPLAKGTLAKDTKVFPQFDAALVTSMSNETATFVQELLGEEKATFTDFFAANHSYVDARLAKLYGVAEPSGSGMVRTQLPPERAGLLGQAGLLATLAHAESTSPTHRGLMFFQTLLCQPVAQPPAGAADLGRLKLFNPNDAQATQRQHFEYAQKNAPECAGCHKMFIPMGLGLENFDALGGFRSTENGRPIDPSVKLEGYGDADGSHANGIALGRAIANSEAGQRCFTMQMSTFMQGREEDPDTAECGVNAVLSRWKGGGLKVSELLVELASSDAFVLRQ